MNLITINDRATILLDTQDLLELTKPGRVGQDLGQLYLGMLEGGDFQIMVVSGLSEDLLPKWIRDRITKRKSCWLVA